MTPMVDTSPEPRSPLDDKADFGIGGWLWLVLGGLVVGLLAGLLGGAFRAVLMNADHSRGVLIDRLHAHPAGWLPLMLLVALCVGVAAWMVQRFAPDASGSGAPEIENELRGVAEPKTRHIVPVKFFGGTLAIGAGLALGREGPCIQMGAVLGNWIGRWVPGARDNAYVLMAAGAGAGLATAFNAPIGGAVFVFEEVLRRFNVRVLTATTISCTVAIVVARLLLGQQPIFNVGPLPAPPLAGLPLYAALGIGCGLLGMAYNRTILTAVAVSRVCARWPRGLQGALIGAGVGLLAWFLPDLVGGGDNLTQAILSREAALPMVLPFLLLRFALGPLSYAASTPGGLFAPLLVLGAQFGFLCGALGHAGLPDLVPDPTAFAVVGMAAFFTATVRSPFTGTLLVIEMTNTSPLLLAMLTAAAAAYTVPMMLGNKPIYDALGELKVAAQENIRQEVKDGLL